jgi:hypothetical protein
VQPRNVRRRTIQPQAAQAQPILSGPNRTAIPTPPTQPMSPEALMAFVQHQQQLAARQAAQYAVPSVPPPQHNPASRPGGG